MVVAQYDPVTKVVYVKPGKYYENLFSEDYDENLFSKDYDENLFIEDYDKNLFSEDYNGNLPSRGVNHGIEGEFMPPNIMAPVNLICTVDGCTFKTGDLDQTVAASVLNTHSTANHVGQGTPSGHRDRLQKLDRPVLTTGCSLPKSTLRFPFSCERRLAGHM